MSKIGMPFFYYNLESDLLNKGLISDIINNIKYKRLEMNCLLLSFNK